MYEPEERKVKVSFYCGYKDNKHATPKTRLRTWGWNRNRSKGRYTTRSNTLRNRTCRRAKRYEGAAVGDGAEPRPRIDSDRIPKAGGKNHKQKRAGNEERVSVDFLSENPNIRA